MNILMKAKLSVRVGSHLTTYCELAIPSPILQNIISLYASQYGGGAVS
jgi:hypothetical protein